MTLSYETAAKMIDHSLLQPNLTESQLDAGLALAVQYNVASVCILPYAMDRCVRALRGTTVAPSCTIGFPHGGHRSPIKKAEAELAIAEGCQELDMVVNISAVLSGNWRLVEEDIRGVIEVAHTAGRKVKVIFENCYLKDEHKIRLCQICGELKADWVKTSTGYGSGGATIEDLKLMRLHSPSHVQVKAAGGVRDFDGLVAVHAVGVTRCGASRTADILDECRRRLGLEPLSTGSVSSAPAGY